MHPRRKFFLSHRDVQYAKCILGRNKAPRIAPLYPLQKYTNRRYIFTSRVPLRSSFPFKSSRRSIPIKTYQINIYARDLRGWASSQRFMDSRRRWRGEESALCATPLLGDGRACVYARNRDPIGIVAASWSLARLRQSDTARGARVAYRMRLYPGLQSDRRYPAGK